MLTRQEFVRCCAMTVCTTLIPASEIAAADTESDADTLRWRLDAARVRYAKLIALLSREVDSVTYKQLLRSLGRECALQHRASTFEKYKGNIKGFLEAIQSPSGWVEKAEYDEEQGIIRITDRNPKCSCPLVEKGVTSADQCDCTLGWQEETYSRILGRRVKAELEESVLRGGSRCVYRIQVVD